MDDYYTYMELLDKRIRDISSILLGLRNMEGTSNGEPFNEVERLRYEHEFIYLNCDIQGVRAENETLIDAIRRRDADVKKLDKAISEKTGFIESVEEKIAKLEKGTTVKGK